MPGTNAIKNEIRCFHKFLENWIRGRVGFSERSFQSEISDHFARSFEFVMPDGSHMRRREILSVLRDLHGTDPTFRIEVKIRSMRAVGGGTFLALYEERQNEEGTTNRRLSLAVLTKRPGSNKITWLHCHESPLPQRRIISRQIRCTPSGGTTFSRRQRNRKRSRLGSAS